MRIGLSVIGLVLAAAGPAPTAKPPPDPRYNRNCKVVLTQRDPYPAPASPWWLCEDKTGDAQMLGPSSKPAPGQTAAPQAAAKPPAAKPPAAKPKPAPNKTAAARKPLESSAEFRAVRECASLLRSYEEQGVINQMKPHLQKLVSIATMLTMMDLDEIGEAMGYSADEVDAAFQAYHRSDTARALYRQDLATFRGKETAMIDRCLAEVE